MEFKDFVENRDLVANELAQGRELSMQLLKLLDHSAPFDNHEFLMDQILATYEKALNLVNFDGRCRRQSSGHGEVPRPSKKRRNTMAHRVEKVKLRTGEELPSDGYSWRKYGQKIILGAKFKRGYFRCTHRHSRGCPALKQVQKSDEDPTVFHVTYVDEHTCTPTGHLIPSSTNTNPPHLNLTQHSQEVHQQIRTQPDSHPQPTSLEPAPRATPLANVTDVETPESDLQEGFSIQTSSENSPINMLEFTLEDLGIDPNFPFDNPEMYT